ncbi:hypothetical protein DPMN_194539 [Dreissena polymorpha]|uniref:Sushi domain-containing protein n=1 Tax=Dreissena polymorpha TaxID=45954 RepID=A0A9D3Y5S7_DREPO|nr:hypothetical protein DPMN_194539 [Dreissena polymorpha]
MWSGSKPKCEVAGCPIPNPPEHGRHTVNHSHIPINDTLEFICDLEYTPGDSMPLKCGNNLQWSAPQPVCISKGSLNAFLTLTYVIGVFLIVSVAVNILLFIKIKRSKGIPENNHGVNKNVEGDLSIEKKVLSPLENDNTER